MPIAVGQRSPAVGCRCTMIERGYPPPFFFIEQRPGYGTVWCGICPAVSEVLLRRPPHAPGHLCIDRVRIEVR